MNPLDVSQEEFRNLAARVTSMAVDYYACLQDVRAFPQVSGAQTRAAFEQLTRKHPCEELGTLCLQYGELEREIDDAGDEAGSRPALQKKMERMTVLIRDRSTRSEQ